MTDTTCTQCARGEGVEDCGKGWHHDDGTLCPDGELHNERSRKTWQAMQKTMRETLAEFDAHAQTRMK